MATARPKPPHRRTRSRTCIHTLFAVVLSIIAGAIATSAPARAQLASAAPDTRVQLAGTAVTVVPAAGFKIIPGATMLAGRPDGMFVMVVAMKTGTYDATIKQAQSQPFQAASGWSNVKLDDRSSPGVKRSIVSVELTEATGVSYRQLLILDNGQQAAIVVATMPQSEYTKNPAAAREMTDMLLSVTLTDKVLLQTNSFKLAPPPGYRAAGVPGGTMQIFMNGEREFVMAVRMPSGIPADRLQAASDAIIPKSLDKQFASNETTAEVLAGDNGGWHFYEREFKGVSRQYGAPVEGVTRLQTNAQNQTFFTLAIGSPTMTQGMRDRARKSFESIVVTP